MIYVAILLIGIVLYLWSVYNQLAKTKTRIGASIQEIGNQLKRQADLIPSLTAPLKRFLKHEESIFNTLAEARKSVLKVLDSANAQKLVEASSKLEAALAPIRAVFESNPQIQSSGPTMKLMDELRDTADKVMYSRRTLIDLTADYNIKLVTFPSNLVAQFFGFKPEAGLKTPMQGEHLEVSKEELKTPKVDL